MLTKYFTALISCLFVLLSTLQTANLEAAGWGTTDEVIEYEGNTWNEVHCDLNGLNFIAYIPNYSCGVLQDNKVKLKGFSNEDAYVILTTFNPDFSSPESKEEFVKMIQDANPNYLVKAIDSNRQGAKYAVDMIPINPDSTYWRYLSTNDRLIRMATNDKNENSRQFFFDSLSIK